MIVIHELGHAFVAHRLGYEVVAIRVGAIHGLCEHTAPDYEWDDVLIAWGGVWAQLCVASVVFVLAFLLSDQRPAYFGPILAFLGYVNLLVALANLAPGAGFDGTKAWRIVPLLVHKWRARRATAKTLLRIVKRKRVSATYEGISARLTLRTTESVKSHSLYHLTLIGRRGSSV